MKQLISALLIFAFGTASAFAGFVDMESFGLGYRVEYPIGVIVHDQRPFVLNGETPANQVGAYIGGLFRKRSVVLTYEHVPLSDEMTEGLRRSLDIETERF